MKGNNEELVNIAVIGSGSWATALIKMLCEKNNVKIRWWFRSKEDVAFVKEYQHNPRYLSDVSINLKKVKPTHKIEDAIKDASVVILVTPAAFLTQAIGDLKPESLKGKLVVSGIKGLLPEKSLTVSDWLAHQFGVAMEDHAIIAGPCHAEEVALERLSYLTIASVKVETANKIAELLACRFVKTSSNKDLYGVEFCAIMKNVIAIMAGICHGLNYGDNFQAVLVTNALAEMEGFLNIAYPDEKRQLSHSAYLGDLLVTAYSQFSRNRTFGSMVGRGYSVKSAQVEMNMIAEGYYAVKTLHGLNQKYKAPMPILEAAYQILYQKKNAGTVIEQLTQNFH